MKNKNTQGAVKEAAALLDYERPIFTSAATNAITNNRAVGTAYYYEDPRKFTLTAQVRF